MTAKICGLASVLFLATAPLHAQTAEQPALDDASAEMAASLGAEVDDATADSKTEMAGPMSTDGPLAFATVRSDGTKHSGTANISTSFNPTYNRYEIQIAGEPYYYLNYATLVTPAGDARFCRSSSVAGRLLVYCYAANGSPQTSRFAFVTFKP